MIKAALLPKGQLFYLVITSELLIFGMAFKAVFKIVIVLLSVFLILLVWESSIKGKERGEAIEKEAPSLSITDSPKRFSRVYMQHRYYEDPSIVDEVEAYIDENKDTFYNQHFRYQNGIIDSTSSYFYDLKLGEPTPNDSIFKGSLIIHSPSNHKAKYTHNSSEYTFTFVDQKNDSVYLSDTLSYHHIIDFEYKPVDTLPFFGYVNVIRFFDIDSLPDQLQLIQFEMAVDTETNTDNPFVPLLNEDL